MVTHLPHKDVKWDKTFLIVTGCSAHPELVTVGCYDFRAERDS